MSGRIYLMVFLLAGWLVWPRAVLADSSNQFINIVNPVRISTYNSNPLDSAKAEYAEIAKRSLSATWLLTYDVLGDASMSAFFKQMDQSQELGLFLEVTPGFARLAEVTYNPTDSWHRAKSLFLSGYSQSDRIMLIDRAFDRFKERFGYYPHSVGAWWIDAYSLKYLHEKYGVVANLGLADQFATDGYQVWGGYWSTPYYPSIYHAGEPARTTDVKLDVVTLEWAPRDPLNGYNHEGASLYSVQDYSTIGLKDDFLQKMIDLYAKANRNHFGQLTIGLEADLDPASYQGKFAEQMELIKNLRSMIQPVTMSEFSKFYRSVFPALSRPQVYETSDFLGRNARAIWYQSPAFRIGLTYDGDSHQTTVIDFRTYHSNLGEPFYLASNAQNDLLINLPSLIDTVSNPAEAWPISNQKLLQVKGDAERFSLVFEDGSAINLTPEMIELAKFKPVLPDSINGASFIKIQTDDGSVKLLPQREWTYGRDGQLISRLTPEAGHFLAQRKVLWGGSAGAVVLGLIWLVMFWKVGRSVRPALLIMPVVVIAAGWWWVNQHSQKYLVTQEELVGLSKLAALPEGKVVVPDWDCLQCRYQTTVKPAVFTNQRDYVAEFSHKSVIKDTTIFKTTSRQEGRARLQQLGVKYIYLTKYQDYQEVLPFSPGDYNVERVFDNASTEIWKVK